MLDNSLPTALSKSRDKLNNTAKRVAEELKRAVDEKALIAPVRDRVETPNADLAAAIRDFNVKAWLDEGHHVAGSKVGITSVAAQEEFGIPDPVYGWLFKDMLIWSGEEVDFATVPQVRVEAEVAFVLKTDVDAAEPTLVDILRAIDFALPAIELVSPRIRDWDVSCFDFIADNTGASRIVLGETPLRDFAFDFRTLGAMTVINGKARFTGCGGAYLGSPLQSLRWLAKSRASIGYPLRTGEVIMTGALGPIIPASRGDSIEVIIGDLPPVRVAIS